MLAHKFKCDSKAVVPVLFLFCIGLWFILRGVSCFKVFPCTLSSCFFITFSFLLALWSPRLGKRQLVCASHAFVCFVRDLDFSVYLLVFILYCFLLVLGVGCVLWLWHSLDISVNVSAAWGNLCLCRDRCSVNTLIRLTCWQTIYNIFYQILKLVKICFWRLRI